MHEQYNELYHYGVKGMKWGVRNDITSLANNRRHRAIKKIKGEYRKGLISKQQKKNKIKSENIKKKKYIEDTERKFEKSSINKQFKMESDIHKQAVSEIPNYKIKNGVRRASQILTGYQIGSTSVVGALGMLAAPSLAPLYISSIAGTTAAAIGRDWVVQNITDKMA